ncbi:hypothetical protein JKP88DRAFT_349344 [Tribonema minus]|uniref:Uncharacterized protein n=1 Tax=Tribonema minus TaxID=303371 RepID=A0A835YTA0_9STRA|nr:hypothetical protein JKP88DRAFT_349344 [Tribonema minus]
MARWARQWPSPEAKRQHRVALARARCRTHVARLRANPDLLRSRRERHLAAQKRWLAKQRGGAGGEGGDRSTGGPEPPYPPEQQAGEDGGTGTKEEEFLSVPDEARRPSSPPSVPESPRSERVDAGEAGADVPPRGEGDEAAEPAPAEPAAAEGEWWEEERGPSSPPPYLKDGYCPFRGLRASPPCARYYVDDPVYERLRLALERLVPGYELLAASSCSSDLLGLVHQWATCFGGETAGACLDLASAGGRGLPGRTCAARPRVDREAEGLRPKEQVLRLLGEEGRKSGSASFVDAWRSGAVQTAFVEHVRRRLVEDSPKPTILFLETAPVYYDACLTGGTLRALASLCARQGVALVTDEVMLSVRCGRPLSSDYARSFRPDAAVLGSKALGSAFVVVRRLSPLKHAFRSQPMMVGQEISAEAAEAAVRAIDYILREDLMGYIAGEGEARRRAAGASGAGDLWHDAPREVASAFPAYTRGSRVLLPLDYRFPPDGGEGAAEETVADRPPPPPTADEGRATRSRRSPLPSSPLAPLASEHVSADLSESSTRGGLGCGSEYLIDYGRRGLLQKANAPLLRHGRAFTPGWPDMSRPVNARRFSFRVRDTHGRLDAPGFARRALGLKIGNPRRPSEPVSEVRYCEEGEGWAFSVRCHPGSANVRRHLVECLPAPFREGWDLQTEDPNLGTSTDGREVFVERWAGRATVSPELGTEERRVSEAKRYPWTRECAVGGVRQADEGPGAIRQDARSGAASLREGRRLQSRDARANISPARARAAPTAETSGPAASAVASVTVPALAPAPAAEGNRRDLEEAESDDDDQDYI